MALIWHFTENQKCKKIFLLKIAYIIKKIDQIPFLFSTFKSLHFETVRVKQHNLYWDSCKFT